MEILNIKGLGSKIAADHCIKMALAIRFDCGYLWKIHWNGKFGSHMQVYDLSTFKCPQLFWCQASVEISSSIILWVT